MDMDRQIMKRKLQCLSVALMIFITPSLFAGPFIRINNIDSSSAFPRIDVTVTVQNMDRSFISGLDEANLLVYEDGYRVNYVKVSPLDGSAEKVHLVFCIDSSRSISEVFLKNIKSSARDLIQNTGQQDQIAIYRFNDRVQLLKNFTANRSDIESAIEGIVRHGKETLLYNSIYDAIQILEDSGVANRAIVVFSDGKDEGSSLTVQDIISFAREKSVPVYFISFMPSRKNVTLERISKHTGGKMVYSRDQADIIGIYRSILSAVKSRYVIRYQSILQPDDKTHHWKSGSPITPSETGKRRNSGSETASAFWRRWAAIKGFCRDFICGSPCPADGFHRNPPKKTSGPSFLSPEA
jgi:VWFA-related protein